MMPRTPDSQPAPRPTPADWSRLDSGTGGRSRFGGGEARRSILAVMMLLSFSCASTRLAPLQAAHGRLVLETDERRPWTDAEPNRELGLAYRELARPEAARPEFERYLILSPAANDAPVIRWYLSRP